MLSSAQSIAVRAPLGAQPRRASAAAPRRAVQTQALFGFLSPAKPKAGPSKAQGLVDELLELSARTDGGINASPAKREQIAELVAELEGYCPKNPLRSPLLFGEYEVLYASKPQTAGGPFRSPLGRAVFPGQRATQSIQEPNICINEISYKTLGFLPGAARQEGVISAVSGDTFQLTFPKLDGKAKGGPPQRIIQIVYLDDRIRVARAIPAEDKEDQEPSFYVFQRVAEEEEVEEEEEAPAPPPKPAPFGGTRRMKAQVAQEEEEEEAPPARRGGLLGTQLLGRRKESLATMAERRYAQQQGGSRGTGSRSTAPQARGGSQSTGTQARKSREEVAAERAAARAAADEERRQAREAAAATKAAAEEERRARQAQLEAERGRLAELKAQAKEQFAEVQGEANEAASAAKDAAAAFKEAEKAAAELLREASRSRSAIDQAAGAAAAAVEQAEAIKAQEKAVAGQVAEARAVLKQLEASARRK